MEDWFNWCSWKLNDRIWNGYWNQICEELLEYHICDHVHWTFRWRVWQKWDSEIFMKTFGQELKNKASFSSDKVNNLRFDLIKEELNELRTAIENKDLLEVADALTDILYVTYGAGHAFGINFDECFDEVQKSNMSKLDGNGRPIFNENGKVMKGPNYFKPNLSKFL